MSDSIKAYGIAVDPPSFNAPAVCVVPQGKVADRLNGTALDLVRHGFAGVRLGEKYHQCTQPQLSVEDIQDFFNNLTDQSIEHWRLPLQAAFCLSDVLGQAIHHNASVCQQYELGGMLNLPRSIGSHACQSDYIISLDQLNTGVKGAGKIVRMGLSSKFGDTLVVRNYILRLYDDKNNFTVAHQFESGFFATKAPEVQAGLGSSDSLFELNQGQLQQCDAQLKKWGLVEEGDTIESSPVFPSHLTSDVVLDILGERRPVLEHIQSNYGEKPDELRILDVFKVVEQYDCHIRPLLLRDMLTVMGDHTTFLGGLQLAFTDKVLRDNDAFSRVYNGYDQLVGVNAVYSSDLMWTSDIDFCSAFSHMAQQGDEKLNGFLRTASDQVKNIRALFPNVNPSTNEALLALLILMQVTSKSKKQMKLFVASEFFKEVMLPALASSDDGKKLGGLLSPDVCDVFGSVVFSQLMSVIKDSDFEDIHPWVKVLACFQDVTAAQKKQMIVACEQKSEFKSGGKFYYEGSKDAPGGWLEIPSELFLNPSSDDWAKFYNNYFTFQRGDIIRLKDRFFDEDLADVFWQKESFEALSTNLPAHDPDSLLISIIDGVFDLDKDRFPELCRLMPTKCMEIFLKRLDREGLLESFQYFSDEQLKQVPWSQLWKALEDTASEGNPMGWAASIPECCREEAFALMSKDMLAKLVENYPEDVGMLRHVPLDGQYVQKLSSSMRVQLACGDLGEDKRKLLYTNKMFWKDLDAAEFSEDCIRRMPNEPFTYTNSDGLYVTSERLGSGVFASMNDACFEEACRFFSKDQWANMHWGAFWLKLGCLSDEQQKIVVIQSMPGECLEKALGSDKLSHDVFLKLLLPQFTVLQCQGGGLGVAVKKAGELDKAYHAKLSSEEKTVDDGLCALMDLSEKMLFLPGADQVYAAFIDELSKLNGNKKQTDEQQVYASIKGAVIGLNVFVKGISGENVAKLCDHNQGKFIDDCVALSKLKEMGSYDAKAWLSKIIQDGSNRVKAPVFFACFDDKGELRDCLGGNVAAAIELFNCLPDNEVQFAEIVQTKPERMKAILNCYADGCSFLSAQKAVILKQMPELSNVWLPWLGADVDQCVVDALDLGHLAQVAAMDKKDEGEEEEEEEEDKNKKENSRLDGLLSAANRKGFNIGLTERFNADDANIDDMAAVFDTLSHSKHEAISARCWVLFDTLSEDKLKSMKNAVVLGAGGIVDGADHEPVVLKRFLLNHIDDLNLGRIEKVLKVYADEADDLERTRHSYLAHHGLNHKANKPSLWKSFLLLLARIFSRRENKYKHSKEWYRIQKMLQNPEQSNENKQKIARMAAVGHDELQQTLNPYIQPVQDQAAVPVAVPVAEPVLPQIATDAVEPEVEYSSNWGLAEWCLYLADCDDTLFSNFSDNHIPAQEAFKDAFDSASDFNVVLNNQDLLKKMLDVNSKVIQFHMMLCGKGLAEDGRVAAALPAVASLRQAVAVVKPSNSDDEAMGESIQDSGSSGPDTGTENSSVASNSDEAIGSTPSSPNKTTPTPNSLLSANGSGTPSKLGSFSPQLNPEALRKALCEHISKTDADGCGTSLGHADNRVPQAV